MTEVLGDKFAEWENLATSAFLALRPYRSVLVSLAMASLGARLPHVKRVADVRIVNDALLPGLVLTEAERSFKKLVEHALLSKRAQVNDSLHTFYMQNFYKIA